MSTELPRGWSSSWLGDGPVVAITGASKGIGRSLAIGLSRKGARIGLLSRDDEKLSAVRDEVVATGGLALAVHADVTDEGSVESALDEVTRALGPVTAAVVNAGITEVSPAEQTSTESFRRVVDTNLTGAFISAVAVGRRMLDGTGGSIVLIGSTFASSAIAGWAAYSASKAGVVQLARVLALEWARRKVRVNVVCPTAVLTDQNRPLFASDPALKDSVIARIPIGRLLEPEELVGPIAFLLSNEASMVTGHTLYVDGGWTLP